MDGRASRHHEMSAAAAVTASGPASAATTATAVSVRRPGPGSVTWDLNGERLAIAGWSRAILLQLAHPLIAAGVARHSGFRDSAGASAARLFHTIRAMLGLTFGTAEEARAVAARIEAIHDRVHGALGSETRAFPRGATYDAHDPRLQAWVHLTMVDSMVRACDTFVRPLTAVERDAYCAEGRSVGGLLRLMPEDLPATWDEVQAAMAVMLDGGEIEVTAEARIVAQAILWPGGLRWVWPLGAAHRLLTIGQLPPVIRDAYGLSWRARDERRFLRLAGAIRQIRRLTPAILARWRAARRVQPGLG